MKKNNLDAMLVTNPKNMHYLSGFYNGEGYLVIRPEKSYVVTDFRYAEYAEKNCHGFEVRNISKDDLNTFIGEDEACGFEENDVSYGKYMKFSEKLKNLVPAGNMINSLREVKDESEILMIKRAAEIADKAFEHICGFIRKGMTEIEIACEIDYFMRRCGAEKTSFDTIVAAGSHGSLPHAMPGDNVLCEGDLVVMDYGCVVGGYASDMTRTVGVGHISSEFMDIYNTVLTSQIAALEAVRAGVSGAFVDSVARSMIEMKYPGCFGHSLGHSVGLDIHEPPNLSAGNKKNLECNNVVTVEPGIYIPGKCGVRIEDLVVVTENGCEILSKSPKNLVIVG